MKINIYLIILLVACKFCEGQNLIQNSSFEDTVACPQMISELYNAEHWINPMTNVQGVSGTPDYFNQCSPYWVDVPKNLVGYQQAHSGNAYAGIILVDDPDIGFNYREYLEITFYPWLNAGQCYHFEMYVSLADSSIYTTDDIGVIFPSFVISGVNNYNPLPYGPQISNPTGNMFDTLNWTVVSANYTAYGGEHILIIGNFKNDLLTTANIINPGLTYTIDMAYVYIDDVSLTPCTAIEELSESNGINIFPNPVNEKLNISVSNKGPSEILIYDIASRIILQQKFSSSVTLNTEQLAKGIYLYEVRDKNGVINKGKVVKE